MITFNNHQNHIDRLSQRNHPITGEAQGFMKRQVLTRISDLVIGVPVEVAAVAQNVLIVAPFEAVSSVLKIGVKTIAFISGSQTLHKVGNLMPGIKNFLQTIARIIKYLFGTLATATLGVFISPSLNFKLHCAMGLVTNRREEAVKRALQEDVSLRDQQAQEQELAKLAEEAAKNEAEEVRLDVEIENRVLAALPDIIDETSLPKPIAVVIEEEKLSEGVAEPQDAEGVAEEEDYSDISEDIEDIANELAPPKTTYQWMVESVGSGASAMISIPSYLLTSIYDYYTKKPENAKNI